MTHRPQGPTPAWMGNRNYIVGHLKRCKKCGNADYRVLVFHHRDPSTKRWNVKQMTTGSFSKELIDVEIAKCDIVCMNCHTIIHWEMNRAKAKERTRQQRKRR